MEFHLTQMGMRFFNGQLPTLIKNLENIGNALADANALKAKELDIREKELALKEKEFNNNKDNAVAVDFAKNEFSTSSSPVLPIDAIK